MNNWKVIPSIVFATVLIFGAGVFTGGLLVNYVKPAHAKKIVPPEMRATASPTNSPPAMPTNAVAKFSPALPEILSKPFLMKLDEQLHLTAEQHKAVEKIITDGQGHMRKLVQDARLEIREELTPEQQKQFDILVKRPNRKPLPPVLVPTNFPAIISATNAP